MVRWSAHRRDGGAVPSGCHACLAAAELKAALRPAPHAFVPRERQSMNTLLLFVATALAEIVGCYLPYLWLRRAGSAWLLLPGAIALTAFVWLLALHPAASGRVYAAYGGRCLRRRRDRLAVGGGCGAADALGPA